MLDRADEVPSHLAGWLAAESLKDHELLIAPEPALGRLDWRASGLDPCNDAPDVLVPETMISGAFAGVAETGSIAMLTSGQSRPSHNLLADTHIVVLSRSQIAGSMEDVWRAVRAQGLPRSLAFITGASRTADIEMAIELGVHGAVRMHVVLVDEEISLPQAFSR